MSHDGLAPPLWIRPFADLAAYTGVARGSIFAYVPVGRSTCECLPRADTAGERRATSGTMDNPFFGSRSYATLSHGL